MAFLYSETQPTTAGIDPVKSESQREIADLEKESVDDRILGAASGAALLDAPSPSVDQETPKLLGKEALLESDRLMAESEARLENTPAYSATLVKQERIDRSLGDVEVIQLRMLHHPTKIALKWEEGAEAGQRLVYAQGENGGNMLVRKTKGLEARLGVLSLAPNGYLALKASRYPVTKLGLLELTRTIRQHRAKDLERKSGVTAKLLSQQLDGREVLCLAIEYESQKLAPDDRHEYRKALIYIDRQSKLPVRVHCYGWPEKISGSNSERLDQTTLLESYAYKNINLEADLSSDDFSKTRLN
ncbi:MAG: DUF1571 domain-containing protein [Chlorobia bacterium]|nr:DUF1571 domain-containing protein [Fimbriimonadaceae bacterium]